MKSYIARKLANMCILENRDKHIHRYFVNFLLLEYVGFNLAGGLAVYMLEGSPWVMVFLSVASAVGLLVTYYTFRERVVLDITQIVREAEEASQHDFDVVHRHIKGLTKEQLEKYLGSI